jgi:hypothetical protein
MRRPRQPCRLGLALGAIVLLLAHAAHAGRSGGSGGSCEDLGREYTASVADGPGVAFATAEDGACTVSFGAGRARCRNLQKRSAVSCRHHVRQRPPCGPPMPTEGDGVVYKVERVLLAHMIDAVARANSAGKVTFALRCTRSCRPASTRDVPNGTVTHIYRLAFTCALHGCFLLRGPPLPLPLPQHKHRGTVAPWHRGTVAPC